VASTCEGIHVVERPYNWHIDPVEEGAEVDKVRDPVQIKDVCLRALVDDFATDGRSIVGEEFQPTWAILSVPRKRALYAPAMPAAAKTGNQTLRLLKGVNSTVLSTLVADEH
jgi:hypothetical protein